MGRPPSAALLAVTLLSAATAPPVTATEASFPAPPGPPMLAAPAVVPRAAPVAAALPGDPQVRPGEWNPKKAPPGWVVLETEHYQVQSQIGREKAERLAEHLEAMLDVYREMLPFRKKLPHFVLKVFRGHDEFAEYYPRGAAGTAAYYDQSNKELVGYDSGVLLGVRDIPARVRLASGLDVDLVPTERARLDELFEQITDAYTFDLAAVLSHEGWHQYFHFYTVSWVRMPSWLDEGVGDYFFTAKRGEDGRYHLGAMNDYRMRRLHMAFDEGTTVPFWRMLEFEQSDYYSNPSVFYAQGWSMVQFLMQNEDPHLRQLIPKLIEDFKDNKNFKKATDKAFKGIDLHDLDERWILWVATTEVSDPLADLAREFGDRIPPEALETEDAWRSLYAWHLARLAEPEDG
ncbi:MAG: DUF1570 domain-containing protein [Planctomycetes bacterium]|nr:DUF1570 domain-containing protein [Planctomycetota bacterium]